MAEDFRLLLGAQFNSASVKQALDAIPQSAKTIQVEVKGNNTFLKSTTEEGNKLTTSLTRVNTKTGETTQMFERTKVSADKMSTSIATASKHTSTLGDRFLDITKKVIAFGAVTSIISGFTKLMYEAVQVVQEFDKAITEFSKVSSISGEELSDYTSKLGELGEQVARTTTEMIEASTEFVKGGYTEEQSAQLAKIASLYQNIADSEVSAGDSASYIISQMKAFNITATDAINIIDKTNQIANLFAVSSTDISTALTKSSSALATYGNTIDESISLVTAGSEVMTNQASKVSKGLRSIGANIVKLQSESKTFDITVKGVTKTIDLFNESGEALSTFDVLKEIAKDWDNMSQAEQSSLALSQAGKTQIDVYTSVLGNFDTALKANEESLNSNGSAMAENAKYMESLEAKTSKFKQQFSELVLGEGGLQAFLKNLVDVGTGVLEFANSDIGQLILQTGLLVGGITLASTALSTLGKSTIVTKALIDAMLVSSLGLKDGIALLTTTMMANPLFLGTVGIGGALLFLKVADELYVSTDELTTKTKELISATSELKNEYDTLANQTNLTESEQNRLNLLNAQIEANKILIQQEYEKASASKDYDESSGATFEGGTKHAKVDTTTYSGAIVLDTETASIGQTIDAYNALNSTKAKTLEEDIKISEKKAEFIDLLSKEGLSLLELQENGVKLTKSDNERLQSILAITGAIETNSVSNKEMIYEDDELLDATENLISTTEELEKAYSALSSSTSDIVSSISELNSALTEQEEDGSLSIDTQLKLIESGYELALSYDEQTGSATLNKDAMIELTESKIRDQIASLKILQTDIQSKLKEDGLVALESAQGFLTLAKAKQESTLDYIGRTGGLTKNSDVEQYNKTEAQIKALEYSLKGLGTTFSGTTSATKSNTDALKEQQDVLEDTKDKYETVIDTILDKYDEEIDKIEELKDAELSRIDDTIDALNAQRDAEEKYWDDKIDALNAQNDAINDQIELQKLQEARALAYSNKVLIMNNQGQFEYGQDESAITSTEEAIDAFTLAQQQEQALALLEQQKNQALASLDAQISAWETYKENLSANFDAQIEAQELLKQNFEDLTTSYEDNQNNLLVQELAGIDLEQANWQSRLENLANFVNEYNKLQAQIGTATTNAKASTSSSSSGTTATTATTTAKKASKYVSTLDRTSGASNAYASGVASVGSNQMAIVGENPELVIGSKANGQLMNLAEGTGVVNNGSLKTFAGLVNSIGKYSGLNGSTGGVLNNSSSNTINNNGMTINGDITVVANNPTEFEGYFKSYNSNMLQESYA